MHREILTALLAPGWSARTRRPLLAVGLAVAGLGAPLVVLAYVIVTSRSVVALGLDAGFLAVVFVVGVAALAARIVALADVWHRAGRPTRPNRWESVALLAAAASLVVGSVAVARVATARSALAPTFAGSSAPVLFDADATLPSAPATTVPPDTAPTVDSTAPPRASGEVDAVDLVVAPTVVATTSTTTLPPPLPVRPESGVPAEALADVTTVLLLGGDAGPGRAGLRTDTMMLFSVHRPSGRASLVSLPRDMRRLLFPPGSAMEARHPYGFDDIANAVYPVVSSNRSLRAAYDVDGVRPGVVAIAQAIGYSLDVTIDDYVLVDMQGFLDLVDALGGVTVRVREEIPMPGNVPGARTQYPDTIGPGLIEMDGSTALGYVRSRYADNDFRRTDRQRDVLAALARQVSLPDVLRHYDVIASAIGGTLRTSLTPDELAETLEIIGGETAIVESVGLVPPLTGIRRPDWTELARVVGAVRLALVEGEPSGY